MNAAADYLKAMTLYLPDGRRNPPAMQRNRGAILSVLERILPRDGLVLEIASGSGGHGAHFAKHLPGIVWQTSEADAGSLASISAWIAWAGCGNLPPPLTLDVMRRPWPLARADAVAAINLTHIAPWAVTEALVQGAAETLRPGGVLYLYGPFIEAARATAPSNLAFDADLRNRDPAYGLRQLGRVVDLARTHDFALSETVDMPANNLSVVFVRG